MQKNTEAPEETHRKLTVSFIGKSNTGKSSIFNNIIGHDVSIVKDDMCTTIDTIKESIEINGKKLFLQDTSGFCTEQKHKYNGEVYKKTIDSLLDSDVVVIVTDDRGVSHKDLEIVGMCRRKHIAYFVIINKYDLVEDEYTIKRNFYKIEGNTDIFFTSCLDNPLKTKQTILSKIESIITQLHKRIRTSTLNKWIETALKNVHFQLRIKYISHVSQRPHEFIISGYVPSLYYLKFIEKKIIEEFFDNVRIPLKLKLI